MTDTLFGARFAEDIESSFFHQKLLQTHFDPSLERLAGVLELLNEQEAAVDAFDHVADAVIRELRLKPETRIGPGEPGEGLSGFIRYVTEWETDV